MSVGFIVVVILLYEYMEYLIIMLYTWKQCNVACQLYLNFFKKEAQRYEKGNGRKCQGDVNDQ